MKRTYITRSMAIVLITLYALVVFGEGYAADVDVTLVVNPKNTEVYAGSGKIVITADASGENLTFKWKLSGPGKLEEEGAAAFYIPPEKIEQTSEYAIVTVTVREPSGQATIRSVTFTILPSPAQAATPSPEPTPTKKKGMGRNTKIALGVGAAAALGGGIALAAGGGDGGNGDSDGGNGDSRCELVQGTALDDDFTLEDNGTILQGKRGEKYTRQGDITSEANPFTGTYIMSETYFLGGVRTYTWKLIQNGSSITGTVTVLVESCCTMSVTAEVSGTVIGIRASLVVEYKEVSCWGSGSCCDVRFMLR